MSNSNNNSTIAIWVLVSVMVIGFLMWGWPQYKVYTYRLNGEATLARAINEKQAVIEDARAKLESAELLSQAEIIRAEGLATAIDKVSVQLSANPAYLKYLWITEVAPNENGRTLIYVPSNDLLPVGETGRSATMSLEDAIQQAGSK